MNLLRRFEMLDLPCEVGMTLRLVRQVRSARSALSIHLMARLAALAVLCPDNPFYLKVTSKLKLVFKMVCMAYLSLAIASIFKDKFHLAKRRVKLKKHNIMIFAATPRPPPFCLAMSRD